MKGRISKCAHPLTTRRLFCFCLDGRCFFKSNPSERERERDKNQQAYSTILLLWLLWSTYLFAFLSGCSLNLITFIIAEQCVTNCMRSTVCCQKHTDTNIQRENGSKQQIDSMLKQNAWKIMIMIKIVSVMVQFTSQHIQNVGFFLGWKRQKRGQNCRLILFVNHHKQIA